MIKMCLKHIYKFSQWTWLKGLKLTSFFDAVVVVDVVVLVTVVDDVVAVDVVVLDTKTLQK